MTAAGRASRQQIANMSDEKTVNVELPAAVSNAPPAPGEPDANTPKNAAGERTSIENAKQFVFGVIALYSFYVVIVESIRFLNGSAIFFGTLPGSRCSRLYLATRDSVIDSSTSFVYSYNFGTAGVRVCTSANASAVNAMFSSLTSPSSLLPCDISTASGLQKTIATSKCVLRDPTTLAPTQDACPSSMNASTILSMQPTPSGFMWKFSVAPTPANGECSVQFSPILTYDGVDIPACNQKAVYYFSISNEGVALFLVVALGLQVAMQILLWLSKTAAPSHTVKWFILWYRNEYYPLVLPHVKAKHQLNIIVLSIVSGIAAPAVAMSPCSWSTLPSLTALIIFNILKTPYLIYELATSHDVKTLWEGEPEEPEEKPDAQ